MKFRVKYKIEIDGKIHSGTETEASWFLVDQQGKMYEYGPMEPVRPIGKEYKEAIPLIQIGAKWLSVEEIEQRLSNTKAEKIYEDIVIRHYLSDVKSMMDAGLSKQDAINTLSQYPINLPVTITKKIKNILNAV